MGSKGQRLEGAANPQPQGEPARSRDCQSSPGTTGAPRPGPANRQQPEGLGSSCSRRDGEEGRCRSGSPPSSMGAGSDSLSVRNKAQLPVCRHDRTRRTLASMFPACPSRFAFMPGSDRLSSFSTFVQNEINHFLWRGRRAHRSGIDVGIQTSLLSTIRNQRRELSPDFEKRCTTMVDLLEKTGKAAQKTGPPGGRALS